MEVINVSQRSTYCTKENATDKINDSLGSHSILNA